MVYIQTAVLGMVYLQTAVLGMVAIQTAVLRMVYLQTAVLYLVIPYTSLAGTGCTIQLAVLYWVWLVVYLNFFSWDWLQYN